MPLPNNLEASKQLLVEGNDQRNFFEAFITYLGISGVQVQNFGGVNDLAEFTMNLAALDEFWDTVRSVGIVRDAEQSVQPAFQSVQGSLRNAGLSVPDQLARRAGDSPSVNVFVLPDNRNAGMLETLLCRTFQGNPIDDCVEEFLDCVRSMSGGDLRNPDKSKAHAFLSTKPHPEVSVGVAARRSYWNLDHSAFDEIRTFLRTL